MGNITLTGKNEVVNVQEAGQFQPLKSQYACGYFACAMAATMARPGQSATGSAATVIANAEKWYAQYNGSNTASNTAGMSDAQEYELLRQIGLHYQALPLDIILIKDWLSWGYPVLLAVTEESVRDLTLGKNPYPWTPAGNHMFLATGVQGSNLLVRDSANCTDLNDPQSLRPGPRLYDASHLHLVSATIAVPPWRPRPASATVLPTADLQIPAGWTDDGQTLTGSGQPVVGNFRQYILNARNGWEPGDVPLEAEHPVDPVELGWQQRDGNNAGVRQVFLYSELCRTSTRPAYRASVGREFVTVLRELKPLPDTPRPAQTSAGGSPGATPDAQTLKRDLQNSARQIIAIATHILAQVERS